MLSRLAWHGVPVLDTDRVAHEVLRTDGGLRLALVERFGAGILGPDGEIDRPSLGRIVFGDSEARKALNALVHPPVGRRWRRWLGEQRGALAVVAVPLLYECGLQGEFDGVLVVTAPEEQMMERLAGRGLTPEEARQRIDSQWPVARKAALATWTLSNSGTLEALRDRTDRWFHTILAQEQ